MSLPPEKASGILRGGTRFGLWFWTWGGGPRRVREAKEDEGVVLARLSGRGQPIHSSDECFFLCTEAGDGGGHLYAGEEGLEFSTAGGEYNGGALHKFLCRCGLQGHQEVLLVHVPDPSLSGGFRDEGGPPASSRALERQPQGDLLPHQEGPGHRLRVLGVPIHLQPEAPDVCRLRDRILRQQGLEEESAVEAGVMGCLLPCFGL
mmetsp:Transcript_5790/g.17503  ORF Transcript_5790/g.17503 Transcript_5790/m.17503 type:complete len:205 (-) Transcript_5790:49-663(-)